MVGAFPFRRDETASTYIQRSLDPDLRAALGESPLVVVVGPPKAGKSRSALHAAQAVLPADAAVIVPRDGRALGQLLEIDPRLRFQGLTEGKRLLWLEGLDSFAESLDAALLDRFSRPERLTRTPSRFPRRRQRQVADPIDPAVKVIATVQTDRWRRLAEGTGLESQAARAVVSRGRFLELSGSLDPADELPTAEHMYPGRDFSAGIGVALASAGTEPPFLQDDGAAAEAPSSRRLGGPGKAIRDPAVLATVFGAFLFVTCVLLYALGGNFQKPKPPTIAQQAAKARRLASAGPGEIVDQERVDFRGSGERSFFLAAGTPSAHRLEIWDREGDRLRRAFEFTPREKAVFSFSFIDDVDGDGADELVGGFGDTTITGELLLPFVVDWDEDAGQYRLVSLARTPPTLSARARDRDAEGLRKTTYLKRFQVVDRSGKESVAGYRSQDFAVTRRPMRLISAYVVRVDRRKRRLVELQAHTFNRTGGVPRVRRCELSRGRTVLRTVPDIGGEPALEKATLINWLESTRGRACVALG